MTPDIIAKISAQFALGINTEVQTVYILAGIRKIIEREETHDQYQYLWFHCNWALHASMDRGLATIILEGFNEAHQPLSSGAEIHDLPHGMSQNIQQISKMEKFRADLSRFLAIYDIQYVDNANNWSRFLNLYARIIEDCPLTIRSPNQEGLINSISIKIENAQQQIDEQTFYKIVWNIQARDGSRGEIFIINSFS